MRDKNAQWAVEVVTSDVPGSLFYALPEALCATDVGCEVLVEMGRRQTSGWVVRRLPLAAAQAELHAERSAREEQRTAVSAAAAQLALALTVEQTPARLKPIISSVPVFLPEQLPLFQWISEYYGASLSEVIDNAIPARSSPRRVRCVRPSPQLCRQAAEGSELLEQLERRAPLQAKTARTIAQYPHFVPLAHLDELGPGVNGAVKALEKKCLVETVMLTDSELAAMQPESAGSRTLLFSNVLPERLTQAQEKALAAISGALGEKRFAPFLLFGVTGSGKTEVYLRAVEQVLAAGGAALVIVPEIALTPQFIDQFQCRLQSPVALLHSQVGAAARWCAWQSLQEGKVRVALGARSAVFAPLPGLSLIIIDEEHESSYKQSDGLRYNARDVAVMRAKQEDAVIVLGSATPSFESLVNAQSRRYRILELPERATTRPLPQLEVVDLTKIKRKEMPSENISPRLREAVQETLDAKGQVIVLYNRRGFASFLQCESCSEVVSCPNCSVPLTLHRKRNRLLCHYCNLSMIPAQYCAYCRDPRLSRVELNEDGQPLEKHSVIDAVGLLSERGGGTEKVVDELAELFPSASIIRMDRDAIDEKGAYRRILGSMRSGTADILVGTQMIAKGHDLPGVTLVGIINADVGLHLPDFRSSEKAYQLLTQASGRCGRGKDPGRVIIQTREANHPTVVATATGRFKAFARYELDFRKRLGYPPFGRLLRLVISSTDRQEAYLGAQLVREVLTAMMNKSGEEPCAEAGQDGTAVSVLGPAPAPHEKLRARYRWHILVKSHSARQISRIAAALYRWRSGSLPFKDFRLAIDVDAVDML